MSGKLQSDQVPGGGCDSEAGEKLLWISYKWVDSPILCDVTEYQ